MIYECVLFATVLGLKCSPCPVTCRNILQIVGGPAIEKYFYKMYPYINNLSLEMICKWNCKWNKFLLRITVPLTL